MSARGFNLIEVMVATAVLGIGMVSSAPLVVYAINRSVQARHTTTAQELGTELLETLRTEVRYDAANKSKSNGNANYHSAWKKHVLPHEVKAKGAAAAECADDGDKEICCQPPGKNDGITYHYGPYAFAREGQKYWACYSLQKIDAKDPKGRDRIGVPAESAEAVVRVLWRGADGGWGSWSLGGLLLDGR